MIFVVALLVFGPKRVPELARTLGRGLAEFRRASNDLRQSLALDELQRDLRRDLTENQTIQRPTPKPNEVGGEPGSAPPGSGDSSRSEAGSPPVVASEHPGELPLDNDHEHHDEATTANLNSPADSDLGNVPVAGSNPADPRRG